MAKKYLDYDGLLYFWNKIKNTFVADVSYNSTSKKIQKTKAGATSDVVTLSTVATSGSYADLSNKPTIPEGVEKSTTTPIMDGTASVGSETKFAAGDHVHPSDTSRVPTTRTVNGKALSADITLDAIDISTSGTAALFGSNINSAIVSLGQEIQNADKVFVATYGTTTYTELATAVHDRKVIVLNANIDTYTITNGVVYPDQVRLYAMQDTNTFFVYRINDEDVWEEFWDDLSPIASPTFTGTPKAPTASAGTNNTQIATTAFVNSTVQTAITGAAAFQGTAPTSFAPTNYKKGYYWVVGTAGTYAGETCEAGDMIFAVEDYALAYSASDFNVIQTNLDITSITNGDIDTIVAA